MADRPDIPSHMKREVRRICGFGCVICGHPIVDYDHIVPYAKEQGHDSDNLVLLCTNHHREKTNGLLTENQVRKYRKDPINLRNSRSSPYQLHYSGSKSIIKLGSIIAINDLSDRYGSFGAIVIVNDIMLSFRIEDEHLLLSMDLRNEKDATILRINDNELTFSSGEWDIEFKGRSLTIREKSKVILFRVHFKIPDTIEIDKAIFWNKSYNIEIDGQIVSYGHSNFTRGGRFRNLKYGFVLNSREEDFAFAGCFIENY